MTLPSLRALTRKALAARAKKQQIPGWHQMTKDELVAALALRMRQPRRGGSRPERGSERGSRPTLSAAVNGRHRGRSDSERGVELPGRALGGGHLNGHRLMKSSGRAPAAADLRDLLTAEATDPYWIHVRWSLSRETLDRAEAALGIKWHQAVPILRIYDVTNDETGPSSQIRVRDVEIHGDVDHWYLPVEHAPRTYKVQIGYRAPSGLFFMMAQSNRVETPQPGSHSLQSRASGKRQQQGAVAGARAGGPAGAGAGAGADSTRSAFDLERRPSYDLRALPLAKLRNGHATANKSANHSALSDAEAVESSPAPPAPAPLPVELRLHAELIVHGMTDPHAELKLSGSPIPVSRDGTFSHRFALPDGRKVIDAVVTTRNGCHQRTIVLGIERNTKELEPQWFDEINAE